MLHKKGGYWADTDLICVKPFVFEEEYVISSEPIPGYKGQHVTSCFIKLPKNSAVTLSAINIQKAHKKLILSGEIKSNRIPSTSVQRCSSPSSVVASTTKTTVAPSFSLNSLLAFNEFP